jgi:hypothetical protein
MPGQAHAPTRLMRTGPSGPQTDRCPSRTQRTPQRHRGPQTDRCPSRTQRTPQRHRGPQTDRCPSRTQTGPWYRARARRDLNPRPPALPDRLLPVHRRPVQYPSYATGPRWRGKRFWVFIVISRIIPGFFPGIGITSEKLDYFVGTCTFFRPGRTSGLARKA